MTATLTEAQTVTSALNLLSRLDGPDDIAAHLATDQYLGHRLSASRCPVALFVFAETGRRCLVTPDRWLCGMEAGPTPLLVGTFIDRFDYGDYPELEVQR